MAAYPLISDAHDIGKIVACLRLSHRPRLASHLSHGDGEATEHGKHAEYVGLIEGATCCFPLENEHTAGRILSATVWSNRRSCGWSPNRMSIGVSGNAPALLLGIGSIAMSHHGKNTFAPSIIYLASTWRPR
jgi:hypothetical protein